ncbi:uncharacterized protein LOC127751103 [Frankliniella occidentalis]|uniref:Uncharacterized protein LOC127751103 n=1 Tax=Frankliniella occidentalis TaxID=133901 RepID=A0A9C6X6M7_FRAOC|nr:uncharacterized protein LOC127751103 [Frankliniella occidentalis]
MLNCRNLQNLLIVSGPTHVPKMADPSTLSAVLRPTYEEFKNFSQFVETNASLIFSSGVVKVIPPEEWTPTMKEIRENLYINSPRYIKLKPISAGSHYATEYLQDDENLTFSAFKDHLERE